MKRQTKAYFDKEARDKLFAGMETAYKSVASTLGSRGRNAAYRRWGQPLITNDGVSILRQIFPEDETERMGSDLIREAAERTNETAGDGTTTATILAYHLIKEGQAMLDSNPDLSAMQLRRELETSLEKAISILSDKATFIKDDTELLKIAKISSENDEIAQLVATSVKEAGDTGRVVVEESQGLKIEKDKIQGMEIEGGYISPYFVTNPEKMEAILDGAYVLVSDKTFVINKEILPLAEEIMKAGGSKLVIVAKDIQSEALDNMIYNNQKMQGKFVMIGVKAPRNADFLEDLAIFCGRKSAITDGKSIRSVGISDCTRVRKVIASKDKCLFMKGDREDTEQSYFNVRVNDIQTLIKDAKGGDKIVLEDRLARITSSVVVIKVGANSDSEIPYLRMKIEDAVFAVKAAIKEGYVAGGGITLASVGEEVESALKTRGSTLFHLACLQPIVTLILNSGAEVDWKQVNAIDGFDTDSGKYVKNIKEMGIIDPVLVEKEALRNSVNLAAMFLTVATVITDLPQIEPPVQQA